MDFKKSRELAEKYMEEGPDQLTQFQEEQIVKAHLAALERIEELEKHVDRNGLWSIGAMMKIKELESLLREALGDLLGADPLAKKIRKALKKEEYKKKE